MMHRKRFFHLIPYLALFCLSCSSKPEVEMQAAQQVMDEANELRAAEYAADDLKNAQEVWEAAHVMLNRERYSEARQLFIKARGRFEMARDVARARRERVLKETEGMQQAVDLRYQSLKENLEKNQDKVRESGKKSLQEAFLEIDQGIVQLREEIEQGKYNEAKITAYNTMRLVYDAEQDLKPYLGG